ncbi:MAG: hypothetical protein NZ455_05995 [Bacteroidia bacterium]|nr:hypothetical protein [Bacteroidia bacterium]MDW8348244.1 hypothetical protein [Bacteroidia bacterium]
MGVSLRCASGRGTPHYAFASVLRYRFALPNGMLRIPHASRVLILYLVYIHAFALPCLSLIIKQLQD